MPVTDTHPQYDANESDWTMCRDAADGSRAVKARGDRYLPQLVGQDEKEYAAYKMRALWYGATGRTIQGLGGSAFRKPPTVDVPETIKPHLNDITLTGVPFEAFAKTAMQEVLKVGRYGVLVEMAKEENPVQRPRWVGYYAEDIINWATAKVGDEIVLTLVVLREDRRIEETDPFSHNTETQYRVLRLVNGSYVIEIYRQQDRTKEAAFVVVETITPTFRGQALPYIPFTFISPCDTTPTVEKPPLLDLVDVNLSHYRSSADLEHGMHYTALPTPWVAGFPETTVLKIGSSVAWVSSDVNAKADMLEFKGDGLGTLERAMTRKESLMAVLGARMLEERKPAVEAADTHRIRGAGEYSVLASLAASVGLAMKKAMVWHVQWAGSETTSVSVEFNKDFYDVRMNPQELAELMKAWQSGAISQDTLYWNMERGELTRPGVTLEQERQAIADQPPARLPLGQDPPDPQDPEGNL